MPYVNGEYVMPGGDDTMFGNQGDDFFNGGYGADNIDLGEDIPLQVRPNHDVVAGTAAELNGDVVHNFNDADVIRVYGVSGMTYRQVGDNTEVVIDGTATVTLTNFNRDLVFDDDRDEIRIGEPPAPDSRSRASGSRK